MAQAKPGAEQAWDAGKAITERVAEQGRRAADQAGEAAREATGHSEDAARESLHLVQRAASAAGEVQREVAHRSAEETAALGRALVDLTVAQTRQNLETISALTQAVDWDQVAKAVDWERVLRIHSEHLRASLERAAELTGRYLELSQAVLSATASATQRQAKKAA